MATGMSNGQRFRPTPEKKGSLIYSELNGFIWYIHVTECLWPHFYASVYGMLVKLCLVVNVFLYTLCCLGEQFLLRSMGM